MPATDPAAPPEAPPADDASVAPGGRAPLTIPAFATLPDVERFLRDAGHFSRREATGIVAEVKALLARKPPSEADAAAILEALKRRAELLRIDADLK
jgi:hypothetical protein